MWVKKIMINYLKKGLVFVEVSLRDIEEFLNELWRKNIKVSNLKRKNIVTIKMNISYEHLSEVKNIVEEFNGKIKILQYKGLRFQLKNIKRKKTLFIGIICFWGTIIALSRFIWAIEIKTTENISPYEVRKSLKKIGIYPGKLKSSIDVYALEKQLEAENGDIVWIWSRIEGSTLKLKVEEKVNPPEKNEKEDECIVANYDGEIKKIYVNSGKSLVNVGDIVKKGDILIDGIRGNDENQTRVEPKGVVVANTFYQKKIQIQVRGEKLERNGNFDKDMYISLAGKRIYLKKSINKYEYYDRIEEKGKVITCIYYYEKEYKKISEPVELLKKDAVERLKESLENNLKNGAKIIDQNITYNEIDSERIDVIVDFVVEQEIT